MKFVSALIFGIFTTWFGFFAGLQVSPMIGNVLVFPFSLSAAFSGAGFGHFSPLTLLCLFSLTSLVWSLVFLLLWNLGGALARRRSHR